MESMGWEHSVAACGVWAVVKWLLQAGTIGCGFVSCPGTTLVKSGA